MVDDEPVAGSTTVGQRLRAAREAKGLTIEDVAATTRIPTRHLQSLENSEWHNLPASTYSVGFAKNYAGAVGLERSEIAEQLRVEMGTELPAHYSTAPVDSFEPVDGNRSMPKGIVVGALIALVAIVLLLTWLSNRELRGDDNTAGVAAENVAAPVAPIAAPAVPGSVVITANEAAWIEVKDGTTVLKAGELAAGQSFEVPPTARAPVLMTAKPEALRISVGTGDAPTIGPAGERVSNVSLLPADLMRDRAAVTARDAIPAAKAVAPRAQRPTQRTAPPARQTSPPPPPAAPENITNAL